MSSYKDASYHGQYRPVAVHQPTEEEVNHLFWAKCKRAVKITLFGLVILGAVLGASGCKNDGNPIQGIVCSTQSSPSIVCPK